MHLPPTVALFLTIGLIGFLFRRDIQQRPNVTSALWIPLVWMFISCSRATSEWLDLFGFRLGGTSLEEGSPLDAFVYFSLIAAGLYVLNKRRVELSEIIRKNQWLSLFFVYCFLAIFWSDFPFVAFKRWIKVLGHPIMVLVVFTEPDPLEALERLMKRCAYVVVPVSVLFIKYFPQWGRAFSSWTGAPFNTGVTKDKNMLGVDCFVFGFFFFWYLLQIWRTERGRARRNELLLIFSFLIGIWWLLSMAQSSTSLVSLLFGMVVVFLLGLRSINTRYITSYVIGGLIIYAVAEWSFGIWDHILALLGKDPTLTDRTHIWHDVLQIPINPILGAGFESFWLGDRTKMFFEKWPGINEAHNGYLETYLNLGLVGLFIMVGLLIATYRKAQREFSRDFELARFRLGFLAAVVIYNWTESAFRAVSAVWFVFYLVAIDYRLPQSSHAQQAGEDDMAWDEESPLAEAAPHFEDTIEAANCPAGSSRVG
jgi:exopolysaccharide production protein ExoQ